MCSKPENVSYHRLALTLTAVDIATVIAPNATPAMLWSATGAIPSTHCALNITLRLVLVLLVRKERLLRDPHASDLNYL